MDSPIMCDVCDEYKARYVAVTAVLSSMGSRESRVEKSAKRMRVCRTCFHGVKFARRILAVIRETGKAVSSSKRAGEWDKN